jgi:hypothetical protein
LVVKRCVRKKDPGIPWPESRVEIAARRDGIQEIESYEEFKKAAVIKKLGLAPIESGF